MKRHHIIVSGRVQGVLYRNFVRNEAGKLGLTGWVMNLQNGTVEIVAEGPEDKLSSFQKACKKGPLLAFVKNMEVDESDATGEFGEFDIHYHDD